MCGSFPLLSTPHSLFSIWKNLKRSENIPGAPTWRWGEWSRLNGSSVLHRNSPHGLNISSIRVFLHIRDPEITITLRSRLLLVITNLSSYKIIRVRRPGVVGRVPRFQPDDPGSIPGGIRILISVLGLDMCPLSILSSTVALTLCWPSIQGDQPLCFCLAFWSTIWSTDFGL